MQTHSAEGDFESDDEGGERDEGEGEGGEAEVRL
jgi:hypothetical protein